jgi:hypothetical protein
VRAKAPGQFGWCFGLLISYTAGCTGVATEECRTDEPAADALQIWQHQNVRDYQFVWQRTCFCLPEAVQPIRITVRDGVIATATDLSGAPVDDSVRQGLLTIDALYKRVLDGERTGAKVRFECAGAGVPRQIYVDPNARVADDEFRVTITQFTMGADAPGAANIH